MVSNFSTRPKSDCRSSYREVFIKNPRQYCFTLREMELYWLSSTAHDHSVFRPGDRVTLLRNSVIGIYTISSTGQLIPFIVGLLSLIRVIHLILMTKLEGLSIYS